MAPAQIPVFYTRNVVLRMANFVCLCGCALCGCALCGCAFCGCGCGCAGAGAGVGVGVGVVYVWVVWAVQGRVGVTQCRTLC